MPEIAEVRLIADNICDLLQGHQITDITLTDPSTNWSNKKVTGLSEFREELQDRSFTVKDVGTRGKFCWVELEDGWKIMIQFGMSGNIRLEPTDSYLKTFNENKGKQFTKAQYLKDCLLKIDFIKKGDQGEDEFDTIYYHDIRRFGSLTFTDEDSVFKSKLNKLGHDPLQQQQLSDDELVKRFRKHNSKNISVVLMDQGAVFAGVGNYIRSETLYNSKIDPYALVKNIPDDALTRLYQAYRHIAQEAYDEGGSSLYTFTGLNGDKSDYKDTLKVYGRSKDPEGNKVTYVPDSKPPAKRSLYWVPSIQTVGSVD